MNSSCCRETEQDVRLCLYSRELNKNILREHFPMKTVEEVAAKVKNAKVYSILDALNSYWQIRLTKVSIFLLEDINICVNLMVSKAQVWFYKGDSLSNVRTHSRL